MTEGAVYYMAAIERELDRNRSTIRSWERNGWLPNGCNFHRDSNGWRYWTGAQLETVRAWMNGRNQGRVSHGLTRRS